MKFFLYFLLIGNLFANNPYINDYSFRWEKDGKYKYIDHQAGKHIDYKVKNTKSDKRAYIVYNDDNVSVNWSIKLNKQFLKDYQGKTVTISEVYKAEYACWCISSLKNGTFYNKHHLYVETDIGKVGDFIERTGYFSLSSNVEGKEIQEDNQCDLYITKISHDEILVYIDDMLLHTFKFLIIPKGYKEQLTEKDLLFIEGKEKQTAIKKSVPTIIMSVKPKGSKVKKETNYLEMYKNTPQIIFEKLHLYAIKRLTYFRDNKNRIFIQTDNGNYAVSRQDFKNASYILFTPQLNKMLQELKLTR